MEYSQKVNTVIMLWALLPILLLCYHYFINDKKLQLTLISAITFIIVFTVATVLMFKTDIF